MLFLNSGTRNPAITAVSMQSQSVPQKMGHSFIVCGCLAIITGLILIIIGVISEIRKTTFIGVGIISLGVGFFLVALICLYGKLDICYNNWAYRSRVLPVNLETPRSVPADTAPNFSFVRSSKTTEKRKSIIPIDSQAPITVISDVDIHQTSKPINTLNNRT